jgi:hypothetical protein
MRKKFLRHKEEISLTKAILMSGGKLPDPGPLQQPNESTYSFLLFGDRLISAPFSAAPKNVSPHPFSMPSPIPLPTSF